MIAISFTDGEYGIKAVLAAGLAIALGPIMLSLASRGRAREAAPR